MLLAAGSATGLVLFIALWLPFDLGDAAAGGEVVFPTDKVVIATADGKRHLFDVELAVTPEQRRQGLMYRKSLADDAGMLFLFDRAEERAFWMKDTFVSLDILFLDGDGRVLSIAEAAVPQSEALIPSGVPAQAVLEVVAGTTDRLGIDGGTVIEHKAFGNAP